MQLSTELIAILTTIVLGWVSWVSVVTIRNQNALTALKVGETNLHKDMEDLTKSFREGFAELKDDVKEQMNKVNLRLDIFLKDEISVLKELARK